MKTYLTGPNTSTAMSSHCDTKLVTLLYRQSVSPGGISVLQREAEHADDTPAHGDNAPRLVRFRGALRGSTARQRFGDPFRASRLRELLTKPAQSAAPG